MRIQTVVLIVLSMFLAAASGATAPASSGGSFGKHGCSVEAIAGYWLFATDVGRIVIDPDNPSKITALGTMRIGRDGSVRGAFDATISHPVPPGLGLPESGFLQQQSYTGTVVVNRNCTGTLEFVTSQGNSRTDSIAIVGPREIWGMSQVGAELWTYEARKLSSRSH